MTSRWTLTTPPHTPGGVAHVRVATPDPEATLALLGLPRVGVGRVVLADALGIDTILVARSETALDLYPHAGPRVVRELTRALAARGIEADVDPDPRTLYPEAADVHEARMLAALARAASPRAIDLLLAQPRRWRAAPPGGPEADGAVLRRLLDPPTVVAIGAPNIGKSSLLNALAGRSVALVHDAPGVTRDHVGATIDLDGLVVRYVDTAGLGPGAIDGPGGRAVLGLAARADLVLSCFDRTAPAVEQDRAALRVRTRADLGPAPGRADVSVALGDPQSVAALARAVREALVPDAAIADARPWRFWPDRAGAEGVGRRSGGTDGGPL